MTGREGLGGQGRIAGPAAVGRAELSREDIFGEEASIQEDSAGKEHPVAEGVQSRERHIARADHQRRHQIEEGRTQRHYHEEHHRRSVHREDAVVLVVVEDARVRNDELCPQEKCFDSAGEEEDERCHPVHDADALVVDRGDPAPDAVVLVRHLACPAQRIG